MQPDPIREMDQLSRLLGIRAGDLRQYARAQAGESWGDLIKGLLSAATGTRTAAGTLARKFQETAWEQITRSIFGGGGRGRGRAPAPATAPAPEPNPGGQGDGSPPGGFRTTTLVPPPPPPPGGTGIHRSLRSTQAAPPLPGESDLPFGEEIVCVGQSSNVYSFSYKRLAGAAVGNLYVTFQGHQINKHNTRRGTVAAKGMPREQLIGKLGSTLTGARGGRGSMYCYFDVPPGVFTRMKMATSKGKFVWDALRIRGTIYGHQYRYSLVQGQVSPGVGVYLPRKATRFGFKTRAVADLGTGMRGFQTSTLPEQTFSNRTSGRR